MAFRRPMDVYQAARAAAALFSSRAGASAACAYRVAGHITQRDVFRHAFRSRQPASRCFWRARMRQACRDGTRRRLSGRCAASRQPQGASFSPRGFHHDARVGSHFAGRFHAAADAITARRRHGRGHWPAGTAVAHNNAAIFTGRTPATGIVHYL